MQLPAQHRNVGGARVHTRLPPPHAMPGSRTPPRSQTTPAITPLEAREFGETLDDAARAQLLCAAELSRWFDFRRKATLLGSGSFGSVRCLLGDRKCFAWRAPAAALMVAPQVFIAHTRDESRERVAIKLLGWRKEPAKARQLLRCAAAALLHAAPASVAARCALLRNVQRSGRVHPRSRRAASCCTWPRPPSVTLTLCRSFRT